VADGSRTFEARESRDPTALTAVYRAHADYVWRVLRHCGVPEPDLDDAVQETFLVVFRRLPEFQARASLRTWIYAVAVRVAATRRRSQRREAARRDQAGHRMHGAGTADPEAELSKAEAAELVDRLLDELDAPKRTVFVLAELEGVKVPEISRILGVNPRTVHSRLRLARESFGSALERLRAREANDRRVARLRPRPLLVRAANDRPPASRRKAVMAALAVRIEQGATPTLAGWEALALAGGHGASWLPLAAVGALGVVAVAAVVSASPPSPGSRSPMGTGTSNASSRPAATRAIATNEPIGRTESVIGVPSVPTARPGTAASSVGDPLRRSRTAIEHADIPIMRMGTTSERADDPHVRTETTSEHADTDPARPSTEDEAAASPSGIAATQSRAARPDATSAEVLPGTDDGTATSTSSPPPSPADMVDASTLAAETLLLEQARGALRRGDLEAVRAALDRHAARFPQGLLLDEARSTRLRALCAGGRTDEANALAERLAQGQPGSRWHAVVAAACR
jgi:RNA polymerase sigma-70 factor (ECF subfamily)